MKCPNEPHMHLADGKIALVPLELAEANRETWRAGRRFGFMCGVLVSAAATGAGYLLQALT